MKLIHFILFFAFALSGIAQNVNLNIPNYKNKQKREIWMNVVGVTSMVLAGFSNGLNEAMDADPDIFGEGQGFWDNESWKRKYKNYNEGNLKSAYPGSKSILSWTTDGKHLTNAVKTTGLFTGTILLTINEKFSLKKTGLRLVGGFVAYGVTSHLTYNHIRYGTF